MAETEEPSPDLTQPYDASDPDQVQKRRTKAGRRKAEDKKVIEKLLETREGRAWYWSHLEAAGVFQTSFSSDALAMAFKEGTRNFGLRLLAEVPADKMLLMMREGRGN